MKTTLLFSALLVLVCLSAHAQVIPNYNFENWTNGVNSPPDAWTDRGSSHVGFYPVKQSSDAYLGNYAIRIETKIDGGDTTHGVASTTRPGGGQGFGPAFPISVRYNNLKGFYKYAPLNGDSAQIIVYLTKIGFVGPWGDLVAWGEGNLGVANTYTPFSIGYLDSLTHFVYMDNLAVPDSGYINLSAYRAISGSSINMPPLGNSVLIVDALNFDSYLTGIENGMDITANFSLYPNANNGIFDVNLQTLFEDYVTIKIYDLEGREIVNLFSGTLSSDNHEFHYNLPELSSGNYLYVIASGKGYRAEKFCVQK